MTSLIIVKRTRRKNEFWKVVDLLFLSLTYCILFIIIKNLKIGKLDVWL